MAYVPTHIDLRRRIMSITRPHWNPWMAFALVLSLAAVGLAPISAEGQGELPDVPVVLLDPADGGYFVPASSVPFRVSKADAAVEWFDVEAIEGEATEPRIVSLSSFSADLAPGTYYSAIRIDLTTPDGPRSVFLPVALELAANSLAENGLTAVMAGVPEGLAQLSTGDQTIEVRYTLTPALHYIVEVVDLEQERIRL